jgi:hypothetical protein
LKTTCLNESVAIFTRQFNKPDSVFNNDLSMPETLSPILVVKQETREQIQFGEVRQLQQGGLPSSQVNRVYLVNTQKLGRFTRTLLRIVTVALTVFTT